MTNEEVTTHFINRTRDNHFMLIGQAMTDVVSDKPEARTWYIRLGYEMAVEHKDLDKTRAYMHQEGFIVMLRTKRLSGKGKSGGRVREDETLRTN